MDTIQIQQLPIEKIVALSQVRTEMSEEPLDALAASICQVGMLFPVLVRELDGKFVIVDGERRFRAAQSLGWKALPAMVTVDNLSSGDVTQRQLIANCQREDLTTLEKARGIKSLMQETGWNASDVSQRLGMSNATVSRLLTLLTLPVEIQEQVATGKIPASSAAELAKVKDPERQRDIAGRLVSGKLTRDDVAKAARKPKRRSSTPKPASERLIAMLGLGRVVSVIAPALSIESMIELLEELLAKARKAKTQNLSLATFGKLLEDQCRA